MQANFDLSAAIIRAAALRAGLKLSKASPRSEGCLHVIEDTNGTQCTTRTDASTLDTMKLIAVLAAEQKNCLISCKSLGY